MGGYEGSAAENQIKEEGGDTGRNCLSKKELSFDSSFHELPLGGRTEGGGRWKVGKFSEIWCLRGEVVPRVPKVPAGGKEPENLENREEVEGIYQEGI